MNWTSILIIVFVIAMVVGPLMLMRPSPSVVRIAKLREQAQQLGLRIHLDKNPFSSNSFNNNSVLAVYSLCWEKKPQAPKEFSLFRKGFTHEIHFLNEWDWNKRDVLTATQTAKLKMLLESLDSNITGVVCTRSSVGLYWNESLSGRMAADALAALKATLTQLAQIIENT